jgi:hypothetical protein
MMELWFLCTALSLNVFDHCMKLYWIPTISLQVMVRTKENNGKVTKGKNSEITLDSYHSCTLHFPLLCLTIVWSCIEFQLLVFKLCSGQGKCNRRLDRPTDHRVTPIYPPKLLFWGYKNIGKCIIKQNHY